MEDIFNSDFTTEESLELPKMTKDEFIQKTRSMLQVIMDGYSSCLLYTSPSPRDS